MRERRASQTAMLVALARALANDGLTTLPGFVDPAAESLLSPGWKRAHWLFRRWIRRAPPAKRDLAIAQLDAITLRVAAVDTELALAVAGGCRQVVLLGAGLDTRAFRLSALAGAAVWEVDHPATQAYKRRTAAALRPRARAVAFVPVDFERADALADRLRESGFRPAEPTAWVWEGVVMYLTDEAVRRTLGEIAGCSAPGSALVLTYHEPHPSRLVSREQILRRALLSFWRERQIGQRPRETMAREIRRVDWEVVRDTGPAEWAARLGAAEPVGDIARVSRLLVARPHLAGAPSPTRA
jgi:methyltransferase (TIGR00027 family)